MSVSQFEKAVSFRLLHDGPGVFVLPNPWDVGSARILAGLGFKALATSSAASAAGMGKRDGQLTREQALAHARAIVEATELPVSADLERGFGDTTESVAETIRLAAGVGLVGCTIEDTTGDPEHPLYDDVLAVERIAAAAEAGRALPFPFTLTARAHNLLYATPSLAAIIACAHLNALVRTSFSLQACPIWTPCGSSVRRCQSQSTSWWASKASPSP
jgi:2-methylisocitrate lyase-like PEP mutase family enzyme